VIRSLIASACLAALLVTAAPAAQNSPDPSTTPSTTPEATAPAPAGVYCGSALCFRIRTAALGKDPESRASVALDVINKYLGGKFGKVTTKPDGKNVRLFLNNELVAIVTAADAAAEKLKSPTLVANKWAKQLTEAFESSKAQK